MSPHCRAATASTAESSVSGLRGTPAQPAVEARGELHYRRPKAWGGEGMQATELGQLPWLAPTLAALVAWGIAQGLVKKYIGEVSAARFCLYYAIANAIVNTSFWALGDAPAPFPAEGREFAFWGLLAYFLDGIAWIFYYQSITYGPISIVGTLSAAYPALTVIFARSFLGEDLTIAQGCGVAAVLLGCIALAYSPPSVRANTQKRW